MLKHRTKYDEEFKKNAVKLSYASPKSVRTIAEDLGIPENLIFRIRTEARQKIFAYIEGSYNARRVKNGSGTKVRFSGSHAGIRAFINVFSKLSKKVLYSRCEICIKNQKCVV